MEYQGAFDRDSVPWAFGRTAEQALRLAFSMLSCRRRYAAWLSGEAARYGPEASLQLFDVDGCQLLARTTQGEFVLVVEEASFALALAFVAEVQEEGDEQIEAVCVAHFEGDAFAALRWGRTLGRKLRRMASAESRGALLAPWCAAAPAKC